MSPSPPLRAAAVVSVNWDGYSVSVNGRGHDRYFNVGVLVLVVVVVIVTSSSSFLHPADPPPPNSRKPARYSANIPSDAYGEEDIVHEDDDDDGNDWL